MNRAGENEELREVRRSKNNKRGRTLEKREKTF